MKTFLPSNRLRHLLIACLALVGFTTPALAQAQDQAQDQDGNEPQQITAKLLMQRTALCGDYVQRATTASGRFVYLYDPRQDRIFNSYNMLRHAGTVYSMAELYDAQPSDALRHDTHRALDFLHRRFRMLQQDGETVAYMLDEDGEASLGGNGLSLLALTEYARVTGDKMHLTEAPLLARWIAHLQQESGQFKPHVIDMPNGEPDDHVSLYYPGEAMLGLLRLYKLDGNERWLNVAAKGADWLIQSRQGTAPGEWPHDCWFLLALNELYRERPKQRYLDHARALTMAIVDAQIRADTAPTPEWIGGFHRPPRATPTSTRTEALCAVYRLLRDHGGDDEPLAEIRAAIERGVRFQLRMQYTRENTQHFRRPARALGAFPRSFDNLSIRVDYVQHNISSFLALHELMIKEGQQE